MLEDSDISKISSDNPSDLPCWEANPRLWNLFREAYRSRAGWHPGYHAIFTEAYCMQWLDVGA